MTNEITITAEQLRLILATLDEQRESEAEYSESGNKAMQYFCEGQANGIEFVLGTLGIAY
jgi:hypothetical protein